MNDSGDTYSTLASYPPPSGNSTPPKKQCSLGKVFLGIGSMALLGVTIWGLFSMKTFLKSMSNDTHAMKFSTLEMCNLMTELAGKSTSMCQN